MLIIMLKTKTWFNVSRKDKKKWLEVELNLPGKHNLLNALASIAVAHELGVKDKDIINALSHFQGISRRCHVYGKIKIINTNVMLIDDYAHHPTEIKATLSAIRMGWPNQRLVVVYQPHRYTRMRDLFEDFSQALSQVEILLILDVYAAGEELIAGADSRSLCRAIRLRGQVEPVFVESKDKVLELLTSIVKENDLILTLGAGDIGSISKKLYHDCSGSMH